ncbi:hypothetical protein BDV95DRAFT_575628 [Massariosphaeria phaeospora]|uniref:F-box domain-containing protein n=1 Tax=Massariosphaeria phaeospora TaxID=100035 RepID=A0A7C8M6X8_9PLEO|nr:hypothetical protein BDV95DRAFT_575628 [Massariosphaeria phaeospora]
MATFATLSTELQDIIIADLALKDLCHLSRTCKANRALTLPLIYRAITLSWSKKNESQANAAVTLLVNILENPFLASLVEQLHFLTDGSFSIRTRLGSADMIPDTSLELRKQKQEDIPEAALYQALERLDRLNLSAWKEEVRSGGLDASIAVLILCCPKLKVLEIGVDLLVGNTLLPRAFRHLLSGKEPSSLERIHLAGDMGEWCIAPQEFKLDMALSLPCFYLPAIQELKLCLSDLTFANDETRGEHVEEPWLMVAPLPTEPPSALHLNRLHLVHSLARPAILTAILSNTPNLCHLDYEFDAWGEGKDPILDASELARAITCVRTTLKHLRIRITPFLDRDRQILENLPAVWTSGALGSFATFHALRYLEVTPVILYGQIYWEENEPPLGSMLPASLETLCLTDDLQSVCVNNTWWGLTGNSFYKMVEHLIVRDRANAVPKLKELVMDVPDSLGFDDDAWRPAHTDELRKRCEIQGLRCTVSEQYP